MHHLSDWPCKLEAAPLQEVSGWRENDRKFWEARLDRLDDDLQTLKAEPERGNGK